MSGDVSPSDAIGGVDARDVAADAAKEATEDHAAAEGTSAETSSGFGSTRTLRGMLLNTSPSVPLDRVESPWDPENGGPTRIWRGIQKLGDFEGIPAIGDLVIGAIETWKGWSLDEVDDGGDEDDLFSGGGASV